MPTKQFDNFKNVSKNYDDLKDILHKYLEFDQPERAFQCLKNMAEISPSTAHADAQELQEYIFKARSVKDSAELRKFQGEIYTFLGRFNFDDYCIALEWNREISRRFYMVRRKQLYPIAVALQELAEHKLDLLCISMPPGTGKSTLAIFFMTWLAGIRPNKPMFESSHSNSFLQGVYSEVLRILTNDEYRWHDIFPELAVNSTDAKNLKIDVGEQKRFTTFQFASYEAGLAGKVRAEGLLYCDDLVPNIEVAMSASRLNTIWQKYTTDISQRKLGDCPELHIATRWSVYDPIGRLEKDHANNPRARFLVFPALDKDDHSLFDYPFNKGYSTKNLLELREKMDDASWNSLYMNQPIEREGILYPRDELQTYTELPEREPDSIISVCDTKDTGTDYGVMPVAYKYGDMYYIEDIVCDNSRPEVVEAKILNSLLAHKVEASRFESNQAGRRIAEQIQQKVKERNGKTRITTKYTTQNKETKIIISSPWVKEHCIFKSYSVASKEYNQAIQMLCAYSMTGRNLHDDVPDAFAQLYDFVNSMSAVATIVKRPF